MKNLFVLAALFFALAFFMGCASQTAPGAPSSSTPAPGATNAAPAPPAKTVEYATADGISFIPPAGFTKVKDGEYFALSNGKSCSFYVTGVAAPTDRVLQLDALGAAISSSMQKAGGKVVSTAKTNVGSYDALALDVSMGGVGQKQTLIKLPKNFAIVAYASTNDCQGLLEAISSATASVKDT